MQALPSSQATVLSAWVQPLLALHPSLVQTLPSLQLSAGPPWQPPPLQASAVVQASLSLQAALLSPCMHPLAGLHESSVQTLLSLQLGAVPAWHRPATQVSLPSQALWLSQSALTVQGWQFACGGFSQPRLVLQESVVQALLSLQLSAAPLTQVPPPQVSLPVQALPSLQGPVLLVRTQPLDELQLSSVQTLLSLQLSAGPP